jgi:hypothetical protein
VTDIDELKGLLKIDKSALDDELVHQASLLFKVSEAYVQAAAHRDYLKEQLAIVDAELDGKVRKQFEDEKVTEAMIKGQIQTHKQHRAASDAYLKAVTEASMLSALKDSFQQRSYMLRDLCSLFVANYYEQNSVRGTDRTDTVTYQQRRKRLALNRDTKE